MHKISGTCSRKPMLRCDKEAEKMGKSVLAAGLLLELKMKVAGGEGTFEELLAKARLEEAKLRDLPPQSKLKVQKYP